MAEPLDTSKREKPFMICTWRPPGARVPASHLQDTPSLGKAMRIEQLTRGPYDVGSKDSDAAQRGDGTQNTEASEILEHAQRHDWNRNTGEQLYHGLSALAT